jgi:hypothetical protein
MLLAIRKNETHRRAAALAARVLLLVAMLPAMPLAPLAQTTASQAWMEQFRKATPDLAQLAEMSSMARPELGAKMLLTIAASPRVRQRRWKRNLLMEAFETAALVREPLPQQVALTGTFERFSIIGTRAQLQENFYREDMDRLSLESSAVTEMLKIDPSMAKELFLRMQLPLAKRAACTDVFLQDPSTYYVLLGKIVNEAFSVQERHEERHLEMLGAKIREMNSPLELASMAEVLRSTPLSIDERSLLTAEFSHALANMELDDRSFSFTLAQTDKDLHNLIGASSSMGSGTEALAAAYRTYLARGFAEARCADAVRNDGFARNVVERFNKELARDGESNLRRFETKDVKPEKVLGEAEIPAFNPSIDQLVEKILDLLFPNNEEDGVDPKITEAAKLDIILRMFEEIEPTVGEDQDSYLMRKGLAFAGVITSMPAGPDRDKLLLRYVDFLNSAADNSEDLAVWIGPLRMLLDHIDSDPTTHRVLLDLLHNSPQRAVSFYERLEQLQRSNAQAAAGRHEPS